jgi:hypothetical protein
MPERAAFSLQRTLQLLSDGVDKVEDEMAIIRVCDLAGIGAMLPLERAGGLLFKGTSKNSFYSPDATKLPPNDSASFSFRFIYVHSRAVRDR